MHKISIEYKFRRGDDCFFFIHDQIQKSKILMVLCVVHGYEESSDGVVTYVIDASLISSPKRKKYQRKDQYAPEDLKYHDELYHSAEECAEAQLEKFKKRQSLPADPPAEQKEEK